jgi:uncharacterized Zn finger protein (UPF0148 family)
MKCPHCGSLCYEVPSHGFLPKYVCPWCGPVELNGEEKFERALEQIKREQSSEEESQDRK